MSIKKYLKKPSVVCLFIITNVIFWCACKPKKAEHEIFKLLDTTHSQVNFVNKNTEGASFNILDYLYFYNGGGMASADFNNDGMQDLYFVSNEGENKLYINKGDLKFEDVTKKAGVSGSGSWKTGVTIVDINGDGFKDIYVSVVSGYKGFTGKNQLYINNGNLTFTEEAAKYGLDFSGFSTQASFFDYDKDGDLDMFLLTSSVHDNNAYGDAAQRLAYDKNAGDHLFRNDGGKYTDVTRGSGIYASVIGYGLGVSVGDLNNDGWDDIYVSNDFFEQDYYYINQKNGTFKEALKDAFGHTSLYSMGNTLSDVNKDGYLDVLSTDMLPEEMKALKSTVSDEPLDIYNQQVNSGYYYQYTKNSLQLNVGNGKKFVDISLYSGVSATDWTWSPLVQDFDMDGRKDMFFSNGIKRRLNDIDYIKYMNDQDINTGFETNRTFDQTKIDLMPTGKVHNYLYHGENNLKFNDISYGNDMTQPSMSSGSIAVDLDNDGDLELVTNNMDEAAYIYQNMTMEHSGAVKPAFLKLSVKYTRGNLDGIGTKLYLRSTKQVDHQEIQTSTAYESTQGNNLLFTFLPGDKPEELLIIWPDNSYQLIKNLALSKKTVITYDKGKTQVSKDVSNLVSSYLKDKAQFSYTNVKASVLATIAPFETPDFNYYNLLPHTYLPHTPAVAVADVNKDGIADIYVGGIPGEEKYILAGNKDGKFTKVTVGAFAAAKEQGDIAAQWTDVNNDGLPDLVVINTNHPFIEMEKALQPRLYINKGNNEFEHKALPKINTLAAHILAYDFNGDGLQDLFFTSAVNFRDYTMAATSAILINQGNGNFIPSAKADYAALKSIRFITGISTADIDHNGVADIIISSEWQPVQLFLNKGKKLVKFTSPVLDKELGWWQSATVTDVDGDGKADLIAGNWGENNKYNVNNGQPLYAYNNDVDNDGKHDLLLSYFYKEQYYPFRPKNDLEQELPYLKKEFLSFQKMAGKTTDEIFKDKISKTGRLEANQFSSIFISDILNAQKVTVLPYLYQQAPVRSVIPLNNKRGDILLNGNFWGVVPYEGKYDALGLVTTHFDKQSGQLSAPEYWLNDMLNPQEIDHLYPYKTLTGNSFVLTTYDGRLMLLTK
ncbi:FG-GAP repeat domain-containing protein [Mucilaginibacter phyllosphaerae]